MKRYLPPLLLLLVLAAVAVRVALRPGCEEARSRIRDLLLDPTQNVAALTELETHLETCRGSTDRWFAAEAYLRAGRYADAIKRVWDDPELARDPNAARRFAQTALEVIGWRDAAHTDPTEGETDALLALVEGQVPWAEAYLESLARTRPLDEVTKYFFRASRFATHRPLEVIVRGFRSHVTRVEGDDRSIELAAAFSQIGRDPYPEREADLELLIDALARLRTTNPDAWVASASGLGRSEDPRALQALRLQADKLAGIERKREQQDLALLRCGLIAAGDWSQLQAIRPFIDGDTPHPFIRAWYLEAVLHRYVLRDPEARIPLGDVWLFIGPTDGGARLRIAFAVLLQTELPPVETEIQRRPVDRMVTDLLSSPDSPESRVTGLSYQLRIGDPTALDRMLGLMTQIAEHWEAVPRADDGTLRRAFTLGMRALLLYGQGPLRDA